MAWTNITFVAGQVLTAAQMTVVQENAHQARMHALGTSPPNAPEAGVEWWDNSQAIWLKKIYTGSHWIPIEFLDTSDDTAGISADQALWGYVPTVTRAQNRTGFADQPATPKNFLLNSAFNYWLRGNSWQQRNTAGYLADRWIIENLGSRHTVSYSQSSERPDGAPVNWSMEIRVDSANTNPSSGDSITVYQRIEGGYMQRAMFGRPTARYSHLSCWLWSNVTGRISVAVRNEADAAAGEPSAVMIGWMDIDVASTWLFKEFSFIRPTTGTWFGGTRAGAAVLFTFAASSNYNTATPNDWVYNAPVGIRAVSGQLNGAAAVGTTFRITGVQYELGQVATPLEVLPPSLERPMLQRYYWKTFQDNTAPVFNSNDYLGVHLGLADPSGNWWQTIRFPVNMRKIPFIKGYNPAANNGNIWDFSSGADAGPAGVVHVSEQAATLYATAPDKTSHASHVLGFHLEFDAEFY